MKKFLNAGFLVGIIALATSGSALASLPAVLAKVNGTDVTRAEIEKAFSNMTDDQPGMKRTPFDKTPPDFQKAFVDKYIERMLIVEAAKKAKIQDDPEIKEKLKTAEEFLIQQKFLTNLVIAHKTDAKLKEIYDKKLKSKDGKQEVHALHILVKTEDEAKKLRQDIAKGADFEKIAKTASIEPGAKVSGGDLGYFTEDQMVSEFSKAAFALKPGEVSQPVQTSFGWHIIKVVDKRQKKIPPFAQVKAALENELTKDVIEDEVAKLRVGADIEYFGDLAKTPAKPVVKPLIKRVDDKKPESIVPEVKKLEEKTAEEKPADKPVEKPADKPADKKNKAVTKSDDDDEEE